MPPAPASVVDLGCGTGSLAVLLAQGGHQVQGLDLSDRMVAAAVHMAAARLYKAECIRTTVFHDGPFKTIADVEYATAGWVAWYSTTRLHGSLGMVPPVEYEQAHYAALNPEPQPV